MMRHNNIQSDSFIVYHAIMQWRFRANLILVIFFFLYTNQKYLPMF